MHLFVRDRKLDAGKCAPFLYMGRICYEQHENTAPWMSSGGFSTNLLRQRVTLPDAYVVTPSRGLHHQMFPQRRQRLLHSLDLRMVVRVYQAPNDRLGDS